MQSHDVRSRSANVISAPVKQAGLQPDANSDQLPSLLSREGAQRTANVVKDRAREVVGQVQDVVILPIAKRAQQVRADAEKASMSLVKYVRSVRGRIGGVIAWTVGPTIQQIKTKGVRKWAVDSIHAAPDNARAAIAAAKQKATQLATDAHQLAKTKSFQTTAASAAGGAVTFGTAGGAAGLATGTVLGAIAGMPAALFTFGLSIPVTAAIGGTCGLVTGAAAGGTVGAVGSGAVGYGAYLKRDEIATALSSGRQQICNAAAYTQERAGASAEFVRERAAAARARLTSGRR